MEELVQKESTKNSNGWKEYSRDPADNAEKRTAKTVPLSGVKSSEEKRFSTSDAELNRVLGGGIVPGSLVLIAGEPGIGK